MKEEVECRGCEKKSVWGGVGGGQPQVKSRKALLVALWAASPLSGSGSTFPLLAGRVLWDTRDAPAV